MPSGQPHGALSNDPNLLPTAIGPRAELRVRRGDAPRYGYCLYHNDSPEPLVILGQDIESFAVMVQFNTGGTQLAWGNVDGTVFVCDLQEVQERLAELGFGW